MTAVPLPRTVPFCQDDDDKDLFSVKDITKNLEKDFATPQVVQRHINRLSSQAYVAASTFMKVYLRVKPFTEEDLRNKENQKCLEISDDEHDVIVRAPKCSNMFKNSTHGVGETCHSFSFTKVFNQNIGQKDFFDATALPVVQDFIGGQNSLIFTYGVTSSGKTHTIQGSPGNEGIMPRSVDVIFNSIGNQMVQDSDLHLEANNKVMMVSDDQKQKFLEEKMNLMLLADQIKENEGIAKDSLEPQTDASVDCPSSAETSANLSKSSRLSFLDFTKNVADESYVDLTDQGPVKFAVFVNFIEIYKDYIYDLLKPLPKGKNKKRPALRLAEEKSIPFVKDLNQIQVTSREEVFKLLTVARNHLHMAETKLNHNSSRSHCIFTIKTVCTTDVNRHLSARVSQISFCDLAGSERWGKTNSFGERLKEAGKINNSLMTLGKCIETLRHNQQHGKAQQRLVPFRESRLTRLFQGILMGHGRACMIVNANQCASMFDETFHVLKFSAVASEIKMDKNPIRKSQRISRRSSRENLSVLLDNALTRKASRTTCGWQPQETTIREEGADSQEEVEDASGDESDDEVTAFWREREEKLLRCVSMYQEALKHEKERVYTREAEVRRELTEEMTKHFEEIDEKWEERLDQRIESVENYGEKRYNDVVEYANKRIDKLVKQRDEARTDAEKLDDECDELDKKADRLEEELNQLKTESSDKISKLETELNDLKSKYEKTDRESVKVAESRQSSIGGSRQSMIENLQQENSDGREIIQEQLREMEEMRAIIENHEQEKQTLLEKYEKACADLKPFEEAKVDVKKFNELEELNSNLEAEVSELKNKCEFLENEAKSQQDEYKNIQEEKESRISEMEKLRESHSNLTQKLDKATEELTALREELESSKQHLKNKDLELQQSAENLKRATSEKGSLLEDLKTTEENKSTVLFQAGALEVELAGTKDKLEKVLKDYAAMKEKASKLELIAEENKEIVVVEMSELKTEVETLSAKNLALTSTLEEAISCAEMKSKELAELEIKLEEERKIGQKKEEELEGKLAKVEREQAKILKSTEKENQRETLKVEAKLASEREEVMKVRKDLDAANRLEKQLISEVDRLQEKLNEAIQERANVSLKEQKRTSLNVELERDVHILTSERDDLLQKTTTLSKELTETKTKLKEIEENQPTMTVAEASELQTLRQKIERLNKEKDELAEKHEEEKQIQKDKLTELESRRNKDVDDLKIEKNDLLKMTEELKEEIWQANQTMKDLRSEHDEQLQKFEDRERNTKDKAKELENRLKREVENLTTEKRELLKESRKLDKEFEETKAKLHDVQESRDNQVATDASDMKTLKHKLKEMNEVQNEQRELLNEYKEAKTTQQDKIVELESRLQEAIKSKEEELSRFRESRDKIASALDAKINSQNACNEMLKKKFDDQILANVQLKSENSRLQAELQHEKKKKQNKTAPDALRKSVSASAMPVSVKQEPVSPKETIVKSPISRFMEDVTVQDMSTNIEGTPLKKETVVESPITRFMENVTVQDMSTNIEETPLKKVKNVKQEAVEETENSSEHEEDDVPAKRKTRSTRRTNSRTAAVKKTSSRRKKVANRPSTPVPTDFSDDARQSRGFPQPEIEMDVTPMLKKPARGRKRTKASKEEPNKLDTESIADENEVGRQSRRRKGKNAAENSDEGDTTSLNKLKNISKMGDMLRNSPVGQALKRMEAAISPSRSPSVISSPAPSTFSTHDQNRQSVRRVRKLHADDISLPLESTPNENDAIGAAGRGVGVIAAPAPGTRRLRRRK